MIVCNLVIPYSNESLPEIKGKYWRAVSQNQTEGEQSMFVEWGWVDSLGLQIFKGTSTLRGETVHNKMMEKIEKGYRIKYYNDNLDIQFVGG